MDLDKLIQDFKEDMESISNDDFLSFLDNAGVEYEFVNNAFIQMECIKSIIVQENDSYSVWNSNNDSYDQSLAA